MSTSRMATSIFGFIHDDELRRAFDDLPQAVAEDGVIVGDKYFDFPGHTVFPLALTGRVSRIVTVVPRPSPESICNAPPSIRTHSVIPSRPKAHPFGAASDGAKPRPLS